MMPEPETFHLPDDGAIPNSSLPLLVYRAAVPADPSAIERLFAAHAWPPAWRNGVYPFHHFHANAHEVLGIAAGAVEVQFGGPTGPVLRVEAGDVVVLPAGVGHCRRSQTDDLLVVGGYPEGAPDPDLHRGAAEAHDAVVRSIAAVPMPAADPVAGRDGPLRRVWGAAP